MEIARNADIARRNATSWNGDRYKFGRFLYERGPEENRWQRTTEIIERSEPGPAENGAAFEPLAREAAAVEAYLDSRHFEPDVGAATKRIVLGTTARPLSHAGTSRYQGGCAIMVGAGLDCLLDTFCMATTLSYQRHAASDKPGYQTFHVTPEAIDAELDQSPSAVTSVAKFFEDWLIRGELVAPDTSLLPQERVLPYELVRAHAKRFVIAHEYAHALVDKLEVPSLVDERPRDLSLRAREIRADVFAVKTLAVTAEHFDGVPANVALQGAALAIKANDTVERLLRRFRLTESAALKTHPPLEDRYALCREAYRWMIQNHTDSRMKVGGMLIPAIIAEFLWQRVDGMLSAFARDGVELHPIWRGGR